ncbi:ATP-dependent RNA helicase mtr4 [Pycnococcus provasolii]
MSPKKRKHADDVVGLDHGDEDEDAEDALEEVVVLQEEEDAEKDNNAHKASSLVVVEGVEEGVVEEGVDADASSNLVSTWSSSSNFRHFVVTPESPSAVQGPLSVPFPHKPARTYAFPLDGFQRRAIALLHTRQCVLVCAHTSAGKTAVAEYAVAMALANHQRLIYTSPLKALSNQKFRELSAAFGDANVGLLTGDAVVNGDAPILVATTEVYRSMLYRKADATREIAWVVYDEVHYIRDADRGHVWEEALAISPNDATPVMLSATVPNASRLAHWVACIRNQPTHIVWTDKRPTPLMHYVYPSGADGLFLIKDEGDAVGGRFRDDAFDKASRALAASGDGVDRGDRGGSSDIQKVVRTVIARSFNPVVVFTFSKRQTEALAQQLSEMNLLRGDGLARHSKQQQLAAKAGNEAQELIKSIFENAIASLSDEDKRLPHVSGMLPMLLRGIAVHHSGMLPLIREVVELLFQENLIKVLFATETFAIGLNMPTKTVVFSGFRKFDGVTYRNISVGEYTQMAGRAGRRGLDAKGTVIMMMQPPKGGGAAGAGAGAGKKPSVDPSDIKTIVSGRTEPVHSQYRLSYASLLCLMRSSQSGKDEVDSLLKRTFKHYECTVESRFHSAMSRLYASQARAEGVSAPDADAYLDMLDAVAAKRSDLLDIVRTHDLCFPFLQSGRVVQILAEQDSEDDRHDDQQLFLSPVTPLTDAELALAERRLRRWLDEMRLSSAAAAGGGGGGGGGGGDAAAGSRGDSIWDDAMALEEATSTSATRMRAMQALPAIPTNLVSSSGGPVFSGPRCHWAVVTSADPESGTVDLLTSCAPPVKRRLYHVVSITAIQLNLGDDFRHEKHRRFAWMAQAEARKRLRASEGLESTDGNDTLDAILSGTSCDGVPRLHPVKDMGVKSATFAKASKRHADAVAALHASTFAAELRDPTSKASAAARLEKARSRRALLRCSLAHREVASRIRMGTSEDELSASNVLAASVPSVFQREVAARKEVLAELGMLDVDSRSVVTSKGHVACGITAGDELLATELCYAGYLGTLDAPSVAAILSCLVWRDPSSSNQDQRSSNGGGASAGGSGGPSSAPGAAPVPRLREDLRAHYEVVTRTARAVAELAQRCRVAENTTGLVGDGAAAIGGAAASTAYVQSFGCGLMEAVHAWASGSDFGEVMRLFGLATGPSSKGVAQEGSFVRCIRRLDDLLRQLGEALEAVGNSDLSSTMFEASAKVQRGIAFAPSLYL